ncbi:CD9 antigen [Halotydeus destructor]|nr:CD9 antigen [Halotydeus destructor]
MLSCIKYIVIIYNFIFWLLGVAILAVSVFLYVDSQNYFNFEDTSDLYMTPFLLFMVLGALMTLVGFLGCCGAVRESTCLLGTYFILCISMCVACSAAVWWSLDNGQIVKERIHKDIYKVIREKYGNGNIGATDMIIDAIQKDFTCCGVKGPSDWATSMYNSGNGTKNKLVVDYGISGTAAPSGVYRVPKSCCIKNFQNCERVRLEVPVKPDTRVVGIHDAGCSDKVNNYIEEQWKWLIIVAGVLIGVQSFALLFACCLCCAISRDDDK